MTAAWFAQQGPAPYQLTDGGTTYRLETNISTPAGAFVIDGDGITLDLNGYTVTYNAAPGDNVNGIYSDWNVENVHITNGGLTQGAGNGYDCCAVHSRQGISWEIDHLTISYQGDNNTGINQAGSGSGSVNCNIHDNTIRPGGTKAALWVAGAVVADGGSGYAVGDTITLGGAPGTPGRGVFRFPTVLQVATLAPGTTAVGTVDVLAQGSYSVESTGAVPQSASSGSGAGATFNITWDADAFDVATAAVAQGGSGYQVGDVLTLSGGSVYTSAATLQVSSVGPGGAVTAATVSSNGGYDTVPSNPAACSGGEGSGATFSLTCGGFPTHFGNFCAINVGGTGGNISIENNDIEGTGYQGIGYYYGGALTSPLLIDDNTIKMAAPVRDGYAIGIGAGANVDIGFEVAGNTIVQSSGRGIIVAGDADADSPGPGDGTIHDNYISVRESEDAGEYPGPGNAIGICLRFGAHDVQVYGNTVLAYAGADTAPPQFPTSNGGACTCIGVKVMAGQYAVNNQVYDNVVTVSTTDAAYTAEGLYADGTSDGSNVFLSNTVTSNSIIVSTNDFDGGGSGFQFVSNTFVEGNSPQGFVSIQAGYWTQPSTGNVYLDNTWQGGASGDDVGLCSSGGAAYSLATEWYLNLTVVDSTGKPIAGATVTAVATGGGSDTETAATDISGKARLMLTQFQCSGTTYPPASSYTYCTPYTLTVSSPGYASATRTVTATGSQSLVLALILAPIAGIAAPANAAVRIVADAANPGLVDVGVNSAGTTYPWLAVYALSEIASLQVSGNAGNIQLTVDFSQGDPLPAEGLLFEGGSSSSGDSLVITGTSGGNNVTITGSRVNVNSCPAINYANVSFFGFDLGGDDDSLSLEGATVRICQDNAISAGTAVTIAQGGVLDLNGHGDACRSVTLQGGSILGGVVNSPSAAGYGLNGSMGLNVCTSGTVVLSGANSYGGGTMVATGTLAVASPLGIPPGGSLTIGAGGCLLYDPTAAASAGTMSGTMYSSSWSAMAEIPAVLTRPAANIRGDNSPLAVAPAIAPAAPLPAVRLRSSVLSSPSGPPVGIDPPLRADHEYMVPAGAMPGTMYPWSWSRSAGPAAAVDAALEKYDARDWPAAAAWTWNDEPAGLEDRKAVPRGPLQGAVWALLASMAD